MAYKNKNATKLQGIKISQTPPSDDQVLTFDAGTAQAQWEDPTGGGGTPGGLDTQIQYNNSGAFGGITNLTTDGTDITLLDAGKFKIGTGEDGEIFSSSDDLYLKNVTQDKDIIFNINDGGVDTEMLRIKGSSSQVILPQINSATTPTLAFGNGDTGIYEFADNNLCFTTAGVDRMIINSNGAFAPAFGGWGLWIRTPTSIIPNLTPKTADDDTGVGWAAGDQLSLISGGKEMMRLGEDTEDKINIEAPLFIAEQASANADTAGYGQLWVKNDTPNTVWFRDDGGTDYQLGVGGSLSFGDAIDGTTGDGISINESGGAVQATGLTQALAIGTNFNTNSAFDFVGASIVIQDNAGAGVNTGLSINNASTDFVAQSTRAGSGIAIRQVGADGVAIYIDGTANVNASTNGLVNVTLNNTQSGASTLCKWDTGTSTQDHLAAHFTGTRFSLQIDDADQAPGTTTNKLYSVAGTLYWNGTDLTAGGGLTWGDSIADTSGTGITIAATSTAIGANISSLGSNASLLINNFGAATQPASSLFGVVQIGDNFNTNSTRQIDLIRMECEDNASTGYTTGLRILNRKTGEVLTNVAGIVVNQLGADGTAIEVSGENNVNTTSDGLVHFRLSNTQSGATIMHNIEMGTSAQAHVGTAYDGSTSAKVWDIATNLTQAGGTATKTTTVEIRMLINGTPYIIEAHSEA
jgi:hypothetical protein